MTTPAETYTNCYQTHQQPRHCQAGNWDKCQQQITNDQCPRIHTNRECDTYDADLCDGQCQNCKVEFGIERPHRPQTQPNTPSSPPRGHEAPIGDTYSQNTLRATFGALEGMIARITRDATQTPYCTQSPRGIRVPWKKPANLFYVTDKNKDQPSPNGTPTREKPIFTTGKDTDQTTAHQQKTHPNPNT